MSVNTQLIVTNSQPQFMFGYTDVLMYPAVSHCSGLWLHTASGNQHSATFEVSLYSQLHVTNSQTHFMSLYTQLQATNSQPHFSTLSSHSLM